MENRTSLGLAAEAVRLVMEAKPTHRKKGDFLLSITDAKVGFSLVGEAWELYESITNGEPQLEEAADVLIALTHLCLLRKWTHADLARMMILKMKLRFDLSPELKERLDVLEKQINENKDKDGSGAEAHG